MGSMNVQIKIMPSSVGASLEKIKKEAKKIIEEHNGTGPVFSEEPIAFGLKALMILFTYPEEKELEELEKRLSKIVDVSSAEMIDIRRAVG